MKTKTVSDASLNMPAEEFRQAGHALVDQLADFLEGLPQRSVTRGEKPPAIRALLPNESLPAEGQDAQRILEESATLLFDHSLFNGHPRFWGYITSSAAPIGALADMLAATVNANVGAYALSPMATEIERQTVRWLAELIGYEVNGGGIFVSGGNMANFLGFLTARKFKLGEGFRTAGLQVTYDAAVDLPRQHLTIYCPQGTHTWISKAAELFGHGTDAVRWIGLTASQQMDIRQLQTAIEKDRQEGHHPFLVIGNAGSVSTGVVDPLAGIAEVCRKENLWFHVDGAYGAPAATLAELKGLFNGIAKADSIALDPHKWLYSPLEAGCILVRNARHLHDAFSFRPEYYNFDGEGDDEPVNFHEYGMQNSRGFRALKVWLSLRQVGKNGIAGMIRRDIGLAEKLFQLVKNTPELEAVTRHLSITTFRYTPSDLPEGDADSYLNKLNEALLNRLQAGGEVFPSNAIIDGVYCLRVCIVNFRTSYVDLEALVKIVLREGGKLHKELMP